MVNVAQRAVVTRLKKGCSVSELSEPLLPKTETTWRLAEMLEGISFDVIRQQLADEKSRTSRGLARVLSTSMFEQASAAIHGCEHAQRVNELLTERAVRAGKRVPASPLGSRARQGSDVGVTSITTTLDTLILRTRRGEPLTQRGLHESQRVPFRLAMLSLNGVNRAYSGVVRDVPRREQDVYGVGRAVIMDSACTMTPKLGLELKPEYIVDTPTEDPENPDLGCPVTFIDRFVRDAFGIVADEAVAKGMISLTD